MGFQRLPFLFSVEGHHHLEKMLIFPNTSPTALALDPKSFEEMGQRGKEGQQYVWWFVFVFLLFFLSQASPLNWDKTYFDGVWDTVWIKRTPCVVIYLYHFTGLVLSNTIHVRAVEGPYGWWIATWIKAIQQYIGLLTWTHNILTNYMKLAITWTEWCVPCTTFRLQVCYNTFPSQWPSYYCLLSHQL